VSSCQSTTVVDQDVKKGIPGILHSRPAKLRMLSAKGGVYDTGRPLSDASWKRGQKFDVRPANIKKLKICHTCVTGVFNPLQSLAGQ